MVRTPTFTRIAYQQTALDVYLLPLTPWTEAMALQRRLVFEVSESPRRRGALILCEHYPIITVGRQGSRRHLDPFDEEPRPGQEVETCWTNRGGGCWLQVPGQLAAYPVLPVEPERIRLDVYRDAIYQVLLDVLEEFRLPAQRDEKAPGVVVGDREIGSVGLAVKDWVAYHGCRLNIHPKLDRFEGIQSNPLSPRKMTSMFRELRTPIRVDAVRESFLRHFLDVFGIERYYLCNPPQVVEPSRRSAHAARRRG